MNKFRFNLHPTFLYEGLESKTDNDEKKPDAKPDDEKKVKDKNEEIVEKEEVNQVDPKKIERLKQDINSIYDKIEERTYIIWEKGERKVSFEKWITPNGERRIIRRDLRRLTPQEEFKLYEPRRVASQQELVELGSIVNYKEISVSQFWIDKDWNCRGYFWNWYARRDYRADICCSY